MDHLCLLCIVSPDMYDHTIEEDLLISLLSLSMSLCVCLSLSLSRICDGITELKQLRHLCLNECELDVLPLNIGR